MAQSGLIQRPSAAPPPPQRLLLDSVPAPPPPTNALVAELDTMQKLADGCNIQVPMEVVRSFSLFSCSTDEFTKGVLNVIAKNQITKGRTDAFKSLRKHLLEELEEAFPDDVEAYRQIRATSAESKRLAQSQSALPNGDAKEMKDYEDVEPPHEEEPADESGADRSEPASESPVTCPLRDWRDDDDSEFEEIHELADLEAVEDDVSAPRKTVQRTDPAQAPNELEAV
ncbi:hypothetical protein ZWY2020_028192 [Hordeum vulgare]|nr:hypothetical protein ZWY2020_028192 [Hordeum vulgare]